MLEKKRKINIGNKFACGVRGHSLIIFIIYFNWTSMVDKNRKAKSTSNVVFFLNTITIKWGNQLVISGTPSVKNYPIN